MHAHQLIFLFSISSMPLIVCYSVRRRPHRTYRSLHSSPITMPSCTCSVSRAMHCVCRVSCVCVRGDGWVACGGWCTRVYAYMFIVVGHLRVLLYSYVCIMYSLLPAASASPSVRLLIKYYKLICLIYLFHLIRLGGWTCRIAGIRASCVSPDRTPVVHSPLQFNYWACARFFYF